MFEQWGLINKRETNYVIPWISAIHLLNNWSLLYLYHQLDSKICYSIDWTIVYPARPAHGVKLLKLGVNIELFSIFRSPLINIVWISWLVICPCTLFKATSTKCILGQLFNYYLKGLYRKFCYLCTRHPYVRPPFHVSGCEMAHFNTTVARNPSRTICVCLTSYRTSMLWSIASCQKRVSADQCRMTVSRAQVYNSWRWYIFKDFG